ncbi:hypothetical protein CGCSCA5_v004709 [Colletotrichum siamense]|nr:hypothetical protein CGCSCA5_v004709 [Colletotrichum siamense]
MPDSRQAASPSLPASVPAATNTGPRRGVPESPRADQSNLHLFGGGGGGGAPAGYGYGYRELHGGHAHGCWQHAQLSASQSHCGLVMVQT